MWGTRNTFVYLCNELRVDIAKRDTDMRTCITVEKRVAIALWFLATNSDYRTIGHLFGISKSSVCKIRQEVCRAIVKLLLHRIPSDSALSTVLTIYIGLNKKVFLNVLVVPTYQLKPHSIGLSQPQRVAFCYFARASRPRWMCY